jgi:excinuclease UvrABC ATPase subunit
VGKGSGSKLTFANLAKVKSLMKYYGNFIANVWRGKVKKEELNPQKQNDDQERKKIIARIKQEWPYIKEEYIKEIRFYMRRTAEEIIKTGKRLLVVQEEEGYGNFCKIISEDLGMAVRTAYRFMNAALKSEQFPAVDFCQIGKSISKVYTLIEAPEEELKKFEQTGLLGGKDIDEIEAMSVKEMREHVKKLRAEVAKSENKIADLSKEIKELNARLPNSCDLNWAWWSLESISSHISGIQNDMNYLIDDYRFIDNPELQARVDALYLLIKKTLIQLLHKIEEKTGYHAKHEGSYYKLEGFDE